MVSEDFDAFKEIMEEAGHAFFVQVCLETIEVYFKFLHEYHFDDVYQAVSRCICEGYSFPFISSITKKLHCIGAATPVDDLNLQPIHR